MIQYYFCCNILKFMINFRASGCEFCHLCPAGTYGNTTGLTDCPACLPGKLVPILIPQV